MKFAIFTVLALAIGTPALAQTAPATTTAVAPAVAAPEGEPATAAAAASHFTLDTPIQDIVAEPKAKAVLDADVPGLTTHESYEMFKAMSLQQLAPYSQGKLSDEVLQKLAADLAAVQ